MDARQTRARAATSHESERSCGRHGKDAQPSSAGDVHPRSRSALPSRLGEADIASLRCAVLWSVPNGSGMKQSAAGTQILLPLDFLEIDSQFGELNRTRTLAGDGGTEIGNQGIHVHRISIDHGLTGELLLDGLSLKHEALGLKDKPPADTRENRGTL